MWDGTFTMLWFKKNRRKPNFIRKQTDLIFSVVFSFVLQSVSQRDQHTFRLLPFSFGLIENKNK